METESISNTELLLIRCCKQSFETVDQSTFEKRIKALFARRYRLSIEHVHFFDVANALGDIVQKYSLVSDWNEFIRRLDLTRSYYPTFNQAYLFALASKIAVSEVSKFPDYRSPAFFRNSTFLN